jgi:type IV fimbrial biogenesis protein FimT
MRGFTLVELILVFLLVGILTAVALPQFSTVLNRARQTSAVNALTIDLNYARSEAVKRNQYVFVCPEKPSKDSLKPAACGNDWNEGWQIVADIDGNGAVDGNDLLLRAHDAVAAIEITVGGNASNGLRFNPLGLAGNINGGPANDTFSFEITSKSNQNKIEIIISHAGRIRINIPPPKQTS